MQKNMPGLGSGAAPSTTVDECKKQWRTEWERLPQEVIDKWVMGVPKVVRLIIQNKGKNNFHG
jgi:hypothetical protein